MKQEPLTNEQIKRIAYVEALLEDCITNCHEILGGTPVPNLDVPSYCAELSRRFVLRDDL